MQALTFFFAFVAVLALIGAAAWMVRRFAGNRLGANTNRGRMPRLAVIDAAAVDGRRRLVLVRRDNVEHLLMIGGPTDIVVEPNIVRAMPSRDQIPPRPAVSSAEPPPRISPLPDVANWNDEAARVDGFEHAEPPIMPEPAPRPVRPAFAEEVRRQPPVLAERRTERNERNERSGERNDRIERIGDRNERTGGDRNERNDRSDRDPLLSGFAPEPINARPEPRIEMRNEPPPIAPARPARAEPMMPRASRPTETPKPPPMPPMPIRAERPMGPPAPPPAPAPTPPPAPVQSAPPLSSADQNLAEMAQRLEAALRRPAEPSPGAPPVAPEPLPARPAPRIEAVPPPPPPAAAPAKTGFENLEDEMASLLGRPKSSS